MRRSAPNNAGLDPITINDNQDYNDDTNTPYHVKATQSNRQSFTQMNPPESFEDRSNDDREQARGANGLAEKVNQAELQLLPEVSFVSSGSDLDRKSSGSEQAREKHMKSILKGYMDEIKTTQPLRLRLESKAHKMD